MHPWSFIVHTILFQNVLKMPTDINFIIQPMFDINIFGQYHQFLIQLSVYFYFHYKLKLTFCFKSMSNQTCIKTKFLRTV